MPNKAALIAPGQGSQRPRGLADQPASAREWFDRASALLGIDLWEAGSSWSEERLGRPSTLQPFLVAWALADVERMRATVPELDALDYVLGHSSGQNSAMDLSAALRFDDGIRFAHERGKHLDLGCEAELGTLVALAGVDEDLAREMGAVAAVVLRVNGAFHTELFRRSDELSQPLIDALPICESFTPLIGNAAGQIITTAAGLRTELSQQYTRPIRWLDALQTAYDRGVRTFVVTGPGNAMAGLVRRFGKAQAERLRIVRLNAPSG